MKRPIPKSLQRSNVLRRSKDAYGGNILTLRINHGHTKLHNRESGCHGRSYSLGKIMDRTTILSFLVLNSSIGRSSIIDLAVLVFRNGRMAFRIVMISFGLNGGSHR